MDEIADKSGDFPVNDLRVFYFCVPGPHAEGLTRLMSEAGYTAEIRSSSNFEDFAGDLEARRFDILISGYRGFEKLTERALSFWRESGFEAPFFILCPQIGEKKAIELMSQDAVLVDESALESVLPMIARRLKLSRELARLREHERRSIHAPKLEALGRLAGGVAHDFNNVLATILICSDQILNQVPADGLIAESIKLILKVGEKGSRLTKQLLAFTRNQISEPEIVDLNSLIRSMGKLLKPLIGEDIEFISQLHPDLFRVKIDPVHVEQILINLIVNARDAMPLGGRLVLKTENADVERRSGQLFDMAPGKYAVFSVADTGHGMDARVKSKIFEPFFTTKGENGTGLGLSTVFGIVKQNQGYVLVESEPGKGSIFQVYLPKSELPLGKLKIHDDDEVDQAEGGASVVLLVEDDRDLRKVLSAGLAKAGFQVLAADSPEGALDMAQDAGLKIDVLLTDVVMPRIRGTDLAKRILLHRPDIKMLFMSGYLDLDPKDLEAFQAETSFIQKPFTIQSLVKRISQLRPQSGLDKKPA
jgi:signal transduction histidine kinase/ActR/RegA family two-component response regulator